MSLSGQVALVTGGARGIGAAVADALAEAGAAVAIGDVDEGGALDTAARIGKDRGTPVLGLGMDITRRDSVDTAIAAVESELGPLGVLVNNAGIDVIKPFVDSTPDEWERIIAVNLMGTFHCCQAAVAVMRPRERRRHRQLRVRRRTGRLVSARRSTRRPRAASSRSPRRSPARSRATASG